MKKILLLICSIMMLTGCFGTPTETELKNGDIVFRNSDKMLAIATGSKYTHCGIIFHENGKTYVYEAIGPVKRTLYSEWIAGKNISIKRYEQLTESQTIAIKSYLTSQLGKRYDKAYNWDDSKMYCSELVWKAYNYAGIKLCDLTKGSDYFASRIPKIRKYFESRGVRLDSYMVSPAEILKSNKLKTI